MKYYIIANNTKITEESIDKLELDGINKIVLFNYLWPLRFSKILDYPNKICISRKNANFERPEKYANIEQIGIDQDIFTEIYFHPHPSHMSDKCSETYQKAIDNYNFKKDKLKIIDKNLSNIRSKIGYPLGKNISTGIIAMEYFSEIKHPEDEIVLVGFSSALSNKYHNPQWEKLYILNQINQNRFSFIQCYGLDERI